MTYQIARFAPIYDPSTDAIIGTRATVLPMTYVFRQLAELLADRLEQDGGDYSYRVIPTGSDPMDVRRRAPKITIMLGGSPLPF